MTSTDEKKLLSGTKVSAIATKFQSVPEVNRFNRKLNTGCWKDSIDAKEQLKYSVTQILPDRTEGHVARFHNARALFEKLGEENKLSHSKKQLMNTSSVCSSYTISNLANLGLDCKSHLDVSSTHSPLSKLDYLKDCNISNPSLNIDLQSINNLNVVNNHNIIKCHIEETNDLKFVEDNCTNTFDNVQINEKKINSKELIKNKKICTSDFCNTNAIKQNIVLNESSVQLSLNQYKERNTFNKCLQNSLDNSNQAERNEWSILLANKSSSDNVNIPENTSTNSHNYHPDFEISSPPPLPFRHSSNAIGGAKKKKPIMYSVLKNHELLKYSKPLDQDVYCSTVSKIIPDLYNSAHRKNDEIPEYAVIKKNIKCEKKVDESSTTLTECYVEPKMKSNHMTEDICNYKQIQPTNIDANDYIVNNNEHVINHDNEVLPITIIINPPETAEKEKKLLSSNNEISAYDTEVTEVSFNEIQTDNNHENYEKTINTSQNYIDADKLFSKISLDVDHRLKINNCSLESVSNNTEKVEYALKQIEIGEADQSNVQSDEINNIRFQHSNGSENIAHDMTKLYNEQYSNISVELSTHKKNILISEILKTDFDIKQNKISKITHHINDNLTKNENNSFTNSSVEKIIKEHSYDKTSNDYSDKSILILENEQSCKMLNSNSQEAFARRFSSSVPVQSFKDNSSFRYRDPIKEDSLFENQYISVTSSESDVVKTINSLNKSYAGKRRELQENILLEDKIVLVENGIHYFEDGNFWVEVAGIPETCAEQDIFESTVKRKKSISFDTGPIRVYSTHSVYEYDRRNEEVDPVAASAEYELEKRVEKMEIFPVELIKGPDGLGLSIIGMGVGADAGLEKLGIFVKTITEEGAAAREGKIQVNDQIVEVDGKSLVGVTQKYAANVLRNTSGLVHFIIGRERDPNNSEVAMLIKQSIEADKECEQKELSGNFRDCVMNNAQSSKQLIEKDNSEISTKNTSIVTDAKSPALSSYSESERSQSPVDNSICCSIEQRSLVIGSSLNKLLMKQNDMDKLQLFLKQLMELINNGASSEDCVLKLTESGFKLHQSEQTLSASRQELVHIRELVSELTNENTLLQKKYARAKRAARELRKDIACRDDFYQQILQENDSAYNSLVKNLKNRIILLETELSKIQQRFEIPISLPFDFGSPKIVTPQLSQQKYLPIPTSISNEFSDTDTSDLSNPDDTEKTVTVERKQSLPIPSEELNQTVLSHSLLFNSARRSAVESTCQLHKRFGDLSNSSSDYGLDESEDNTDEDVLLRNADINAVNLKLSNLKKKKKIFAFLTKSTINPQQSEYVEPVNTTILQPHTTISSQVRALTEQSLKSSKKCPSEFLREQLNQVFAVRDHRLDMSDTACDITQHLVKGIRHAINETNEKHKLNISHNVQLPSDVTICDKENKDNLRQLIPIADWSKENVYEWLVSIGLEKYASRFSEVGINGSSLLRLESRHLKSFSIQAEQKIYLKKKLKELRSQSDQERKEQKKVLQLQKKLTKLKKNNN